MIEELENLLKKNNISEEGQQKIIAGFKAVPFNQRGLIFGALKGHPKLIPVFINLMDEKIDLIKNPSKEKMDLLIKEEEKLIAQYGKI